jgi:hypothetical protein
METTSPSGKFSTADLKNWVHNTLIFLSPVAIIYLVFVAANIELDGFQLLDFVPDNIVIGAGILYLVNVALDFFRKLKADNTK